MIEITLILFYCLNVLINRQLNKYTFNKYNHIREPEKWLSSIFGTRYFLIKIIKRQKDNWYNGKYWYESKKKKGKFSNIINF